MLSRQGVFHLPRILAGLPHGVGQVRIFAPIPIYPTDNACHLPHAFRRWSRRLTRVTRRHRATSLASSSFGIGGGVDVIRAFMANLGSTFDAMWQDMVIFILLTQKAEFFMRSSSENLIRVEHVGHTGFS